MSTCKQEKTERAYARMLKAQAAHKAAPSAKTEAALVAAETAFELAETRAMFGEVE